MKDEVIRLIVKKYGLQVKHFLPKNKGYRNHIFPFTAVDEGKLQTFALIIYKHEEDIVAKIKAANQVSNYLNDLGYPARKSRRTHKGEEIIRIHIKNSTAQKGGASNISSGPYKGMSTTPQMKQRVESSYTKAHQEQVRYACVYNFLDGHTIPWEGYTKRHIKLLGKLLSDMHFDLGIDIGREVGLEDGMDFSFVPDVSEELERISAESTAYLSQVGVRAALSQKLKLSVNSEAMQVCKRVVEISHNIELNSILHMDLVRSNVLFSAASVRRNGNNKSADIKIAGILDFEKVGKGSVIFDIARTLAFLLVDCKHKPQEHIWRNFLYSGYAKRGKNILPDLKDLPIALKFFWLYDFVKFLRHNPYEFLRQNEHFRRTVQVLIRNDILSRI